MVDAGDSVSLTLKKEFGEEAMNSLEASEEEKKAIKTKIEELFKSGVKVIQRCCEVDKASIIHACIDLCWILS